MKLERNAVEPRLLDLLTASNAVEAKYMLVGAHAVGLFGRPRATKDIDLRIEASAENARRVAASREDLLANERAAGRPQDVADVDVLERQKSRK